MKTKMLIACIICFLEIITIFNKAAGQSNNKNAEESFRNYFTSLHKLLEFPTNTQSISLKNKFYNQNSSDQGKFTNINISLDSFPQNEPSIKFNHKYPNFVLAAWRDFRTGYSPLVRRVGYSYSSDGGLTWSESKLLPQLDTLHPLTSDPAVISDTSGNFYIATVSGNVNHEDWIVLVYKSTDLGSTFNSAVNVAPHVPLIEHDDKEYITSDFSPTSPYKNTLYITWTRHYENEPFIKSLLSKSTNEGMTWGVPVEVISPQLSRFFAVIPSTDSEGNLYIVGGGVSGIGADGLFVCKSVDNGISFTSTRIGSSIFSASFPSIAIDNSGGVRNNYLYVSWNDNTKGANEIYCSFSSNKGLNWSEGIAIDSANINSDQWFPWLSVSSSGNIFCVYHQGFGGPSVFKTFIAKSTNGGLNFSIQDLNPSFSIVGPGTPGYDYIGMDSKGGRTIPIWVDQSEGGINSEIYSTVILDNPSTIKSSSAHLPDQFSLYQNYPNPFNPVTKIKFDITQDTRREMLASRSGQDVRLVVYDALGREAAILVNEQLPPGSYEVEFEGSNIPSGIYFYKLMSGDFSDSKRMILLK